MKRILILPRKATGIIDIRSEDYLIIDNVNYLEEIFTNLRKAGKNETEYKFCQFEEKEMIPYFINIKDKLTNGYAEFEISRIKFKSLPTDEEKKKSYIEERNLIPIYKNLATIKNELLDLMIEEFKGNTIKEAQKSQTVKKLDDTNTEISKFDYKKYLNEIV